MSTQGKTNPKGYSTLTPCLTVKDVAQAIEFYKKAFGACEVYRMDCPTGGGVMHAELEIGDSKIMLGAENLEHGCRSPVSLGGSATGLYLYVDDVDAAFKRAISAGATSTQDVTDMFWGDRMGSISDPSGHHWMLATHKEDLTAEQIRERAEAQFASTAKK